MLLNFVIFLTLITIKFNMVNPATAIMHYLRIYLHRFTVCVNNNNNTLLI